MNTFIHLAAAISQIGIAQAAGWSSSLISTNRKYLARNDPHHRHPSPFHAIRVISTLVAERCAALRPGPPAASLPALLPGPTLRPFRPEAFDDLTASLFLVFAIPAGDWPADKLKRAGAERRPRHDCGGEQSLTKGSIAAAYCQASAPGALVVRLTAEAKRQQQRAQQQQQHTIRKPTAITILRSLLLRSFISFPRRRT